MDENVLIPHLFRTEYRKIIAVLCKVFGVEHLNIAEDIVSDTFLLAAETWGLKGLPNNPTAWLYKVSKNKAIDFLRNKNKIAGYEKLEVSGQEVILDYIDLSSKNITDSQLQMMFAICHPSISIEAQIGLSLSVLCGFGVEEIAEAFLSNKETIYKRLARAKEKLRQEHVAIEMPTESEINNRLEAVLKTLYLLFSEGYYSSSQNTTLRKDFCLEAMRLNLMIVENASTNIPSANALLSLMCFHASRFNARTNEQGALILYEQQDESLWSKELIDKGVYYLNRASTGKKLTKYHLEAAIAYWHTQKNDSKEKWENILQLYNRLLQIEYSPLAALNRTYALAKANTVEEAISEAEKLELKDNHFYYALLGELYASIDKEKAFFNFKKAYSLAKSSSDKQTLQNKMEIL